MKESALEIEFVVHYRELDNASGPWEALRVRQLCNLLNLTQRELARLLRIPPGMLDRYVETGKFPGCIKLMLELIERSAMRTYLGKTYSRPLLPLDI
jgi:hypothetical protein